MFKKIKIYIVFFQFKYFLNFILILLSLIWLSQIMRLVDLKYSISNQILEVVSTTLLVIPSYLNPLAPVILLISYFYLNFTINATREIIILNQYLNYRNKFTISILIKLIFIIFFYYNYEFLSPKTYQAYKLKELEIRNNFKLGMPNSTEFHIDKELSIFFKKKVNQKFYDVESVLYKDNQFIKSKSAILEYGKHGYNIIFINGLRIKVNEIEKSKTVFEKFTYTVNKSDFEQLLLDKEHYNTMELIKSDQIDFVNHGHNRVIYYLFFLVILISSSRIIYRNRISKTKDYINLILFILLLTVYIINSFLLYQLNIQNITLIQFYLFNSLSLSIFLLYVFRSYENK